MIEDRINIGLSVEASRVADKLEETDYFEDRLSIAKFALAYAIKNELDSSIDLNDYKIGESGGTKWNIGSVDTDKYLYDLILSLYPDCQTPYRYIEALINLGLMAIDKKTKLVGMKRISTLM